MSAIHINRPHGEYVGQVKRYGARTWRTVITTKNSARNAMAGAVKRMGAEDKRVRVLFCAEWYDQVIVMEGYKS